MIRAAIIFLAAALVGCGAGLTKEEEAALTPEQRIFKLANEVNIAFEPAVAYAQQPKCSDTMIVACHDPKVVKIFLRLREEANAALATARANPDTAAISVASGTIRRILAELQAELLKVKTQGASYGTGNAVTAS